MLQKFNGLLSLFAEFLPKRTEKYFVDEKTLNTFD